MRLWGVMGVQGTKGAKPNEAHMIAWGVIGVEGGEGAKPNEAHRRALGGRKPNELGQSQTASIPPILQLLVITMTQASIPPSLLLLVITMTWSAMAWEGGGKTKEEGSGNSQHGYRQEGQSTAVLRRGNGRHVGGEWQWFGAGGRGSMCAKGFLSPVSIAGA
jgi:hypothetical protein